MDFYPWDQLPSGQLRWRPVDGYITGDGSVFGEEQRRNPRPGFRWQAELSNINLARAERASLWEALLINWRLGAEVTRVPRYAGPLSALKDGQNPLVHVTHSDGSVFSDGSLYAEPAVSGVLLQDLPLGATSATVAYAGGRRLRGGEPFSLEGPTYGVRLHGIARLPLTPLDDAADGTYVLRFGPPAREDYPAGTSVDFATPSCVMRPDMTQGDKMWPTFERPFKALTSITFIETFKMSDDGDV